MFKARSELVTVPVVVTDKFGTHVGKLNASDFSLTEDGQPQKIASFEEVTLNASHDPTVPPELNQFKNIGLKSAAPIHLNMLVLDLVNTPFEGQAYATDQLIKYLQQSAEEGKATSLFLIGRNGLELIHDFTTDNKVLIAALKQLHGSRELVEQANQEAVPVGTPPELANLMEMQRKSEQRMESLERVTAINITLRAMRQIALHCAGLPGRKSMIWASGGFPFTVNELSMILQIDGPHLDSYADVADLYKATWQDLNQAQIALYPVDVRGLVVSNMPDISVRSPRSDALSHASWMQSDTIHTFKTFAEATGGRAFYNTNDLAAAFHNAAADNDNYYVLSYYLDRTGKKDGWHKLAVRVSRSGVSVRARNGFFLDSNGDEKARRTALNMAIQSPLSSTAISIRGTWEQVTASPQSGKKRAVFVLTMPANFAEVDESDGNHMKVEFVAVAMTDKARVAGETGKTVDAHLKPDSFKQIRESGMDYRGALDLPPGDYTVHFIVQDQLSGRLGSVITPLKMTQ